MGVAVLQPQDCLREGVSHHRRLISPPRSKPRRASATHNPTPSQTRSGRKKQWSPSGSPPPPQTKPNNGAKAYRTKSPDLTAHVRILKRGELLAPTKQSTVDTTPVKDPRRTKRQGSVGRANSDPVALSAHRMSPEPGPVLNPFINGFYAGSAFSTNSPPPSSLPLPGFCTKSIGSGACLVGVARSTAEDVAAVDLRRMLRIE